MPSPTTTPRWLLTCAQHTPTVGARCYPDRTASWLCGMDQDCTAPIVAAHRVPVVIQGGMGCTVGEDEVAHG